MPKDLWPIVLVGACVAPMIIGALRGSLTSAALGAGVVMCLVVFVAYPVLGHLGYLAMQGESFGRTVLRALAVIPGMMVLGAIGYGVRMGFRRMLAKNSAP